MMTCSRAALKTYPRGQPRLLGPCAHAGLQPADPLHCTPHSPSRRLLHPAHTPFHCRNTPPLVDTHTYTQLLPEDTYLYTHTCRHQPLFHMWTPAASCTHTLAHNLHLADTSHCSAFLVHPRGTHLLSSGRARWAIGCRQQSPWGLGTLRRSGRLPTPLSSVSWSLRYRGPPQATARLE